MCYNEILNLKSQLHAKKYNGMRLGLHNFYIYYKPSPDFLDVEFTKTKKV